MEYLNTKNSGIKLSVAEAEKFFPFWHKLSAEEQTLIVQNAFFKKVSAGTVIHNGSSDCMGLLLIRSGQLRAYISSAEGKEITIYRLFELDICLFSAACMMKSIQFDITVAAEKDGEIWVIPLDIYKDLMDRSAVIANYTNEVMGTRFTDVMWLLEQVMWKSFDKRLAAFLTEEGQLENTDTIKMTHEQIAAHLGTAREVVTRMLKYFQTEGLVKLNRGSIQLISLEKLKEITD